MDLHSQFEQRKIGVTVKRLVFTLLCDIFLENRRGLRVVSIETVEDCVDVFGPFGR